MDTSLYRPLHELRREILASRTTGRVIVEFSDGVPVETVHDARHVADGMLALMNLPLLGPHWFVADRIRAASILMAVLHWDLETFTALVPERQAAELAGKLFGYFPDDAMFLTNVRPHADVSLSPHKWASGSELEELDAGVAVVSRSLVGLVWIEDRR